MDPRTAQLIVDDFKKQNPLFPCDDDASVNKFSDLFEATGLPLTVGNLQMAYNTAVQHGILKPPDPNTIPLSELRARIEGAEPINELHMMPLEALQQLVESVGEQERAEAEAQEQREREQALAAALNGGAQ